MYRPNCCFFFGGGQIPNANEVLSKVAEYTLKRGDFFKVYGIHNSFMGLADSACYEEFTVRKAKEIQKFPGTYLSTCREVNPSEDKWFTSILKNFVRHDIKTVIIAGGDGSSRAANALKERLKEEKYEIQIVFIPCTIDGINGSDSIGKDSAIAESERQAVLIMANAFATLNPKFIGARVAVIEMQGRNRNDIAINVMRNIIAKRKIGSDDISNIKLIFIPAGYKWSFIELMKEVNSTDKKTAIIVSEGAKPIEPYWEGAIVGNGVGEKIKNLIKSSAIREVNFNAVGYLSQTNDKISTKELKKIQEWVCFAVDSITNTKESIVITKNDTFEAVPLKEFSEATESKKMIPLTEAEEEKFKKYLL